MDGGFLHLYGKIRVDSRSRTGGIIKAWHTGDSDASLQVLLILAQSLPSREESYATLMEGLDGVQQ